ncbi:MAG: VWA domain-containing protein [Acidobacteriota bacterium]|nr:VWA domain-containing protein [Blastocatellia bacterium]MDW8240221.1 VWA domain-containing protein [Acidobacteriota bacterium]
MLRVITNLLVIFGLIVPLVVAQNAKKVPRPDPEQIILGTIGVNLPVTVVDKKGRLVTDLTANDFIVLEDGQRQQVQSLSKENELPLNISLLMDASNSVRPKLKFEKDAAMSFLDTAIRRGQDEALLVAFSSRVELIQDFTDNLEDLRDAIHSVKASGTTAMYDAIYRVCEEKMPTAPGRRAIILLSDGEDTASRYTIEEAIEMAQKTEVTIYCIGTTNAGPFGVVRGTVDAPGNKELIRIAEETGGRAYFPASLDELDKIFADISAELRAQYILFYVSTNQARDGKFRRVEVKVANRDGLRVRVKRGFTAPLGDSLL